MAYLIWGVIPIYFMAVRFASAPEVLAHRIVWSVILLAGSMTVLGQIRLVVQLPRQLVFGLGASSLLLASNWLIYVWACFHGRMIETSLGYYINPLVTVMLGVASLPGLAVEVLWLMPAALAYLAWNYLEGGKMIVSHSSAQWSLLAVGGRVTILPLLASAASTMRIPLTILGFLQYLSPSIALVIAILIHDEQMRPGQILTFACIWLALLIFSGEGLYDRYDGKCNRRRGKPA